MNSQQTAIQIALQDAQIAYGTDKFFSSYVIQELMTQRLGFRAGVVDIEQSLNEMLRDELVEEMPGGRAWRLINWAKEISDLRIRVIMRHRFPQVGFCTPVRRLVGYGHAKMIQLPDLRLPASFFEEGPTIDVRATTTNVVDVAIQEYAQRGKRYMYRLSAGYSPDLDCIVVTVAERERRDRRA